MSDEIEDAIRDAVGEPASASEDGQSATARPIGDLIEADRYLAQKASSANGRTGIRYMRGIPGDAR